MIQNPNKTKALVVSKYRTVNPSHGDLLLSEVSICAGPNIDILGVKFDSKLTFEDNVRAWHCFTCLSENWYYEVGETYILWTPLCYFVAILHLFSQSLSTVPGVEVSS